METMEDALCASESQTVEDPWRRGATEERFEAALEVQEDVQADASADGPKGNCKTAPKRGAAACHNKDLGRRGEDAAARFLQRRGYEILNRNWVCPAGEADIVARDDDDLVFVEVKTRSNIEMGLPSEAVDKDKRERYEKIAALYLREFDAVDIPIRFDVISILVVAPDRALVRHHINAFCEC